MGNGSSETQKIDFSQFLKIMIEKMSEKDSNTELESAFELFDLNGDNFIDIEDLRKVCQELKEDMTEEELEEMLRSASKQRDDGKKEFKPQVNKTDFF